MLEPAPIEQAEKIRAFAAAHGWEVKIHPPAAYGIVADFQRQI